MESIANFLGDFGTSLVLIVIVGAHILEEVLKGFRRFLNLEWFRTGREDFPVTKLKALIIDQVGLFLGLALLALGGTLWPILIWVAVGFITADVIQHGVFSIGRRKYTPGIATSALYFMYVLYFFARSDLRGLNESLKLGWALGGMALGAAGLAFNYVLASWKVRKWRREQASLKAGG
ncbi:MAG: HXXEE domain-containing protein [Acidobacteriota bacterium]